VAPEKEPSAFEKRTLVADVLFWHAADYVFMSVYLFIKRKSSSDGGGPRARRGARRVPSLSTSPEIKWHLAKTHDGPWRLTTNTQTHPQGNSSSLALREMCAPRLMDIRERSAR